MVSPEEDLLSSASPIDISGIDIDALYGLDCRVVDAVPENERQKYRYWRGASLARIVINFARGARVLNASNDGSMHFTDQRDFAVRHARNNPNMLITQLSLKEMAELNNATGKPEETGLPNIVFALDEPFNTASLEPANELEVGFVFRGRLALPDIDPYSRAFIECLVLN